MTVVTQKLPTIRVKKHRPNYRLIKIHRTYTMEEAAAPLKVHKHTVREWIRRGLKTIDQSRPFLIHGHDLYDFLKAKRMKNKQKCQSGEMYCLRCRVPRKPWGDVADYLPSNATTGSLMGFCPVCECRMYRRVNPAKIDLIKGILEISFPNALRHITETTEPFLNSDLREVADADAKTQPR